MLRFIRIAEWIITRQASVAMQLFDSKLPVYLHPKYTRDIFFAYNKIAALPVTKSQVGK